MNYAEPRSLGRCVVVFPEHPLLVLPPPLLGLLLGESPLAEPDTLEYFGAVSQLDKCDINSWLKLLDQLHLTMGAVLWCKVTWSPAIALHDSMAWRFACQGTAIQGTHASGPDVVCYFMHPANGEARLFISRNGLRWMTTLSGEIFL